MCIQNPDINISGNTASTSVIYLISPSFAFTCNGRVTGVTVHLFPVSGGTELPVFQVMRPVLSGSSIYSIIGQVQFQTVVQIIRSYHVSTVLLTGDDQIEFQPGDVIAYYQPPAPSFAIRLMNANNAAYLNFTPNLNDTTTDINDTDFRSFTFQPLINITTGTYVCKYM